MPRALSLRRPSARLPIVGTGPRNREFLPPPRPPAAPGPARSFLIVGAGLYGAVCARELADAGHRVQVLEKRDHIGGNCFTRHQPEAGCHQHVYGPHIFHTNSPEIWAYISRFTEFNSYIHRVQVSHHDRIYSFPINLFTLNQVFGVTTPTEAEQRLVRERIAIADPRNLEDWCLSQVGRELYELFIRGYTAKQWHKDPRELPASIIKRLPIRTTFDDRYFSDRYQGIPIGGYTAIFERLLAGIPVELGVDFLADRDTWLGKFDHVIYTGPVDAFFGFSEGVLGYRSLRFESRLLDCRDAQGVAIMNYTDAEVPHTRLIEHKHFDQNLQATKTLVTTEFPEDWKPGLPEFYPVNTEDNQTVFRQYERLRASAALPVTFGGRLGEYRYYDMHQVIAAALTTVARLHQH